MAGFNRVLDPSVRVFRLLFAALVGAVLVAAPCGCSDKEEDDSGRSGESAAGVKAVRAHAPADMIGVVHADVSAIRDGVKKALASRDEELGPLPPGLGAVLDRVDSIDVFLLPGPREPMPLAVVHGKVTLDELLALAGLDKSSLQSGGNGRYSGFMPFQIIDGREADDVDDGVLIIGMNLSDEVVAALGSGKDAKVWSHLENVDTSAPVWGMADLSSIDEDDAPAAVYGSIDPAPGGKSGVTVIFKSEDAAKQAEAQANEAADFLDSLLEFSRSGSKMQITARVSGDKSLIDHTIDGAIRARNQAKRVVSMANLRQIGMAVEIYANQNNNQPPESLLPLVKDESIPVPALISPFSGKPKEGWDPDAGRIPDDYVYLRLPESAPGERVRAYERPEFHKGEGTNVLYADGHVDWVEMERFQKELAETRALIGER